MYIWRKICGKLFIPHSIPIFLFAIHPCLRLPAGSLSSSPGSLVLNSQREQGEPTGPEKSTALSCNGPRTGGVRPCPSQTELQTSRVPEGSPRPATLGM